MFLEVQDLTTCVRIDGGLHPAVDGVSFGVEAGGALGLIGETGCGKTLLALSLLKLVRPPVEIIRGRVLLEGTDVLNLDPESLRRVRGGRVGLVFQDPAQSLDPLIPVGRQIVEVVRAHTSRTRAEAGREAVRLIGEVGLAEPERIAGAFPHQLSGGMQQRIGIALAIAGEPGLLVADEPTTALDMTVRSEVLSLIGHLRESRGMALLLISHDLSVVSRMTEEILVMYAGRVVESARTGVLFEQPWHPYSKALVCSLLRLGDGERLPAGIPGTLPELRRRPAGCAFHPRCGEASEECTWDAPPLKQWGDRRCACFRVCPEAGEGEA